MRMMFVCVCVRLASCELTATKQQTYQPIEEIGFWRGSQIEVKNVKLFNAISTDHANEFNSLQSGQTI